ncbi:hypothetical protein NL676_011137 [Syzygium grande]|nr:hypothetical protein NL676_011137 [Syzygium grande]
MRLWGGRILTWWWWGSHFGRIEAWPPSSCQVSSPTVLCCHRLVNTIYPPFSCSGEAPLPAPPSSPLSDSPPPPVPQLQTQNTGEEDLGALGRFRWGRSLCDCEVGGYVEGPRD